mmetsp:Transcript_36833/g.101332  ORF Transcript_36833/g.101332 Transcript_36833/m.101332 type:complete len:236 (-) Transcript_36833:746-1453(-)
MPGLLEVGRLVVAKLPNGVEGCIAHTWVLMLDVLQEQLRHLVHVVRILDVLHCLLQGRKGRVLRLPAGMRHEARHEREERNRGAFDAHCLDDTVDRLLASMEQLVRILFAFLVVHPLGPRLELIGAIFDLDQEISATLHRKRGELRHALGDQLGPFFGVGDHPLQRQAPDPFLSLARLEHRCKEFRWFELRGKLLLEKVGFDRCDLCERLDALLDLVCHIRLRQSLEHLVQDAYS